MSTQSRANDDGPAGMVPSPPTPLPGADPFATRDDGAPMGGPAREQSPALTPGPSPAAAGEGRRWSRRTHVPGRGGWRNAAWAGLAAAALGLCGGVLGAPAISLGAGARTEAATVTQAPDLAAQLRYIGRDTMTGLPAPVDDRFIAAHEVAIERYGKDERDAIPPPAPKEVDIASIGVADIGVTGRLARYGVDRFGRLDVPQDRVTVGWNPGFSALPGEGGATFFAAHYEYGGLAGIFNRISLLRPGAVVDVTLTDGSVARYRVTSTVDYPLGAIDMGAILLGREGRESITLMTCSGPPDEGEYPLRTVVLAERIE